MQSISEEDETDDLRLALVARQPSWSPPPRLFIKKMLLSISRGQWAGEWSPVASAFLTAAMLLLAVSLSRCLPPKTATPEPSSTGLLVLRACLGLWGVGLLYTYVVGRGKQWTLTMFTLWTWALLSLRMCACALASAAPRPVSGALMFLGNSVRFAVVCQAALTVILWWCVCVPMARVGMDAQGFRRLMAVSLRSFVWVNLHGLVLPYALVEWWMTGGVHSLWELWVQVVIAWTYLMVYLLFADPKLWQWYPFLSPRTHLCGLVYALLLAAIVALFMLLNSYAGHSVPP